jgi:HSP20 family protein
MVQIIRRSAAHPFHQLQSEMDRMFGSLLPAGGASTLPAPVDLRETDEEVLVHAEVPGFQPDELDLQIIDGVLTIAGEKKNERESADKGWHVTERSFGSLRRRLRLPSDVDATAVTAEVKHGVLTVRLPKTPAAQPRKISVQTAD